MKSFKICQSHKYASHFNKNDKKSEPLLDTNGDVLFEKESSVSSKKKGNAIRQSSMAKMDFF
jgi:hypothetical protein